MSDTRAPSGIAMWFRFFWLSFFSDKIAKEGSSRGYFNAVLGLFIALVFVFCGFIAADVLPLFAHYRNAPDFGATVHKAFVGDAAVSLSVSDGILKAARGDVDAYVDTIASDADAQSYSVNGFDVVVDTRDAGAYAVFEAYCESGDDRITYEEYSQLSDADKEKYDFKVKYTADELVLTPEFILSCEQYLSRESEENSQLKEKLDAVKAQSGDATYDGKIYELAVSTYYPSITRYEKTATAPLLRNYYLHSYVDNGAKNFLFLFGDACMGSFETKSGLEVNFYGVYSKDCKVVSAADADEFIGNIFRTTSSVSAYMYLMNTVTVLPLIVLMPVIVALLTFCILKLMRSAWCEGFGCCLKTVGSFTVFAGLFSAIVTFVCGYFVPRGSLFVVGIVSFFAILLLRSAAFMIDERVRGEKLPPRVSADSAEEA